MSAERIKPTVISKRLTIMVKVPLGHQPPDLFARPISLPAPPWLSQVLQLPHLLSLLWLGLCFTAWSEVARISLYIARSVLPRMNAMPANSFLDEG